MRFQSASGTWKWIWNWAGVFGGGTGDQKKGFASKRLGAGGLRCSTLENKQVTFKGNDKPVPENSCSRPRSCGSVHPAAVEEVRT
eukprot:1154495-Pelagomonas_calceolata.AAC.4